MATEALSVKNTAYLGFKARVRRVSRLLTQAELAAVVGVSPEEVNLLECGQPLHSEIARRLLLELGLRL